VTYASDAAQAYRGAIPADRWRKLYMAAAELDHDIAAGVGFWVAERDGRMAGVMGIQDRGPVALVRHACVATALSGARGWTLDECAAMAHGN
jgi:hypothetical protein